MKIPEATICTVCRKFFCCEQCRKKHEIKAHAIVVKTQHHHTSSQANVSSEAVYVLCPICSKKPFLLKELIYDEVLEHISEHHLPLRCKKCDKIYTKIEELSEFSKCIQKKSSKESCTTKTVEENGAIETHEQTEHKTISTQTSPMLATGTAAPLSPISIINLRWHMRSNKATHEISDSVSSIKNLSSMSNASYNRRSIGTVVQFETKGKLVRTTSTPVHAEADYNKPRGQNFDASSSGQVSSIYNSGCDVENEKHTPASSQTAVLKTDMQENIFRKLGGRPKVAAVTPLRQVMSKSIQKAFAEQKKLVQETAAALSNSPLDLRLSPALRRYQSDSLLTKNSKNQTNFKSSPPKSTILKTQKCKISTEQKTTTTNAIIITRYETKDETNNSESLVSSTSNCTSNSVYKTCQSIEIITSTESSKVDLSAHLECNSKNNSNHLEAINTPITRLAGAAVNKKIIKFETPNMKNDSKNEKFHTPMDAPIEYNDDIISKSRIVRELSKYSPLCRPSIRECAQSTAYSHYEEIDDDYDHDDEIFLTPTQEKQNNKIETTDQATQHGNGLIWSFMSSVLKKGTKFLDKKSTKENDTKKLHKTSIIKRCASIAGSLVRSNSLADERQTLKRKRTNTFDGPTSPLQALRRLDSLPQHLDYFSSTKRLRIQGRKPIDRMRNTSFT